MKNHHFKISHIVFASTLLALSLSSCYAGSITVCNAKQSTIKLFVEENPTELSKTKCTSYFSFSKIFRDMFYYTTDEDKTPTFINLNYLMQNNENTDGNFKLVIKDTEISWGTL